MARILFLVHRIPYPPNKGDKIRSWHFLQHLQDKHDVHLGFYVDDKADLKYVDYLRSRSKSLCFSYVSKLALKIRSLLGLLSGQPLSFAAYPKAKLQAYVAGLLERDEIDLIFLFSGAVAPLIKDNPKSLPVIADLVDVDSAKWEAYGGKAAFPLSWLYKREGRLLAKAEAVIAQESAITTFVSCDEAALFRSRLGTANEARVEYLNNGVNLVSFDPARFSHISPQSKTVVFTGAMDYPPNIEAAEWFIGHVWPGVRAACPDATFTIAGGPVPRRVKALEEHAGVQVTGYVDDMAEVIAASAIVVAPLQTARGVQNKVLEGMAMGKAVIATMAAKEGIDAETGKHLLVADDPSDFTAQVLKLLNSPADALRLGQAAHHHIMERYDWGQSLSKLDQWVDELLGADK